MNSRIVSLTAVRSLSSIAACVGVLAYSSIVNAAGTIYWNQTKQEIDGFGASGSFMQPDSVRACNSATQTDILDKLFSTTNGAGLSIIRIDVGDGGVWGLGAGNTSCSHATIEPQEGVWDLSALNDGNLWFMNQAKSRAPDARFMASVWSPPKWMKSNGTVENGGSLLSDKYQAYADYLSRYVREYKAQHNIDIYAISLANEPDFSGGYSSCNWSGANFRDILKNNIAPTWSADGVQAKVIIGESMNWGESYATDALNDVVAAARLDIVASHAYGEGYGQLSVANSKGKKVWETEVSNLGANDNSMNDAMKWATNCYRIMAQSNGSAWLYWWAVTVRDNGEALITKVNKGNNTYLTNKRLWAIGQFSRFVRPGWVRDSITTNPAGNVYAVAFRHPSNGQFAVVALNLDGQTNTSFDLALNGFSCSNVTPYRTSSTEDLVPLPAITGNGSSLTLTANAFSVTTWIGTAGATSSRQGFRSTGVEALSNRPPVYSSRGLQIGVGETGGYQVLVTDCSGAVRAEYKGIGPDIVNMPLTGVTSAITIVTVTTRTSTRSYRVATSRYSQN